MTHGPDDDPLISTVAQGTGTAPGNWEHVDGPGDGYWLRNDADDLEAYATLEPNGTYDWEVSGPDDPSP